MASDTESNYSLDTQEMREKQHRALIPTRFHWKSNLQDMELRCLKTDAILCQLFDPRHNNDPCFSLIAAVTILTNWSANSAGKIVRESV